jgi:ribose transport system substrate-binding protein
LRFLQAQTRLLVALAGLALPLAPGCDRSAHDASTTRRETGPHTARPRASDGLRPDDDRGSVGYADLLESLGPISKARKRYTLGAVMKSLGNPYFQRVADGMWSRGKELGVSVVVQAGATESDQEGQRAVLEAMIDRAYDAILVSPQTDLNLSPAVVKAREKRVLLIDVDGALLRDAAYYVGPNHYQSGVAAARYFMAKAAGGKVAVIKGVEADYGASQRSKGFIDTLAGTPFRVVAQPFCVSDLQMALQAAAQVLDEHPDIRGFFCSNDVMALGVAQAVRNAGKTGAVIVIGRDGIASAHDPLRAGGVTGTVDTFPFDTGKIAVEVAVRILEGQNLPRVIVTPHEMVAGGSADGSMPDGSATR